MKNRPVMRSAEFLEPDRPESAPLGGLSGQPLALSRLDEAVERFNTRLGEIEKKCTASRADPELLKALSDAILEMASACKQFEDTSGAEHAFIKQLQKKVRENTDRYFLQSRLMRHARTWPKGYPGDYIILEAIYNNTPDSEGLGYYLDWYFLSTILARAVRGRKDTMRDLLMSELASRHGPKIMNLGSGSCREVAEVAQDIISSGARFVCIDADQDALDFCSQRCGSAGLASDAIKFRRYNALKMVNHDRNLQEFGMQDIIYSIGLFDYLKTDILVPLISALYRLLNPGGKLIFSFKDSDRYSPQEYHWLVDWDSFFQRTSEEHRTIIEKAGIPAAGVTAVRDVTGVIAFYIAGR